MKECIAHYHACDCREAEFACWKARAEKAEVQLAGCSSAALGYGGDCKQGDYGWSASFGDVMKLRAECDAATARIKRLEEMLAMMAEAFERLGFMLIAKQCRVALEEGGG